VASALARVRAVAVSSENLLPPLVDAVKVGVTLGEISDALREQWGTYDAGGVG
jgi:methylmalonyl-CoA mutase N-terminal domain/subunit